MGDIYINSVLVGSNDDLKKIRDELISKRRKGKIDINTNVAYYEDRDELHINTSAGRVRRPLIVVENGKPLLTKEIVEEIEKGNMTWKDVVNKGIIEFVDAEEEENCYVAMNEEEVTEEHTHMELDPLFILGVDASLLPFPEKNRGDRLNYGSRMIVQATGIYLQNYHTRDDTTSQILAYPEIPIVKSQTSDLVGLESHPGGQNLVVALIPYRGYNIEDALIVNKASIERGLGRSYFMRTYVAEARKYWGGQEDEITIPDSSVRGYKSEEKYRHLSEEGIVNVETELDTEDVLIGRTSPLRFLGVQKEVRMGLSNRRDNSVSVKKGEEGVVEKVIITEDENGNKIVKVTVREHKIPEIGDKFASRHGQKGVIGLIVSEKDMPFTREGITPDIIMNPHAIPSRMTVGQLLELVAGKTGALLGKYIDGSAFASDEQKIRALLESAGFRNDGKEILYDGVTGERLEVEILIGIGYYQRLYHMVSHKMHARSRGSVALLTKQPTEGRSKGGGLRLGEMEKDCLIAHGAALTLKERFGSDMSKISICPKCGVVAEKRIDKGNKLMCPLCGNTDIKEVELSYAFKLLLDEMKSMLMYPKIVVE